MTQSVNGTFSEITSDISHAANHCRLINRGKLGSTLNTRRISLNDTDGLELVPTYRHTVT